MKRLFILFTALSALVMLAGCNADNSGASRDTRATMQAMEQASTTVPVPAIINWAERRELKMIYELRDNPKLVTYTYKTDMNGKLHPVCVGSNSVGYPIPYSAQFTAPKALVGKKPIYPSFADGSSYNGDWHVIEADQPEPNGIYMPSSSEATWVLCVNPSNKDDIEPVYVEDRATAYPWRIPQALDY